MYYFITTPLDPGHFNRVCFHNSKSFFIHNFVDMRYPVSYAEMKKRIQSAMLFLGCVYIIHEFRIRFNPICIELTDLSETEFLHASNLLKTKCRPQCKIALN